MTFSFSCPWCGADASACGSEFGLWRYRLPCELCSRDMVVTRSEAGELQVTRRADAIDRSDEPTQPIRLAQAAG